MQIQFESFIQMVFFSKMFRGWDIHVTSFFLTWLQNADCSSTTRESYVVRRTILDLEILLYAIQNTADDSEWIISPQSSIHYLHTNRLWHLMDYWYLLPCCKIFNGLLIVNNRQKISHDYLKYGNTCSGEYLFTCLWYPWKSTIHLNNHAIQSQHIECSIFEWNLKHVQRCAKILEFEHKHFFEVSSSSSHLNI